MLHPPSTLKNLVIYEGHAFIKKLFLIKDLSIIQIDLFQQYKKCQKIKLQNYFYYTLIVYLFYTQL